MTTRTSDLEPGLPAGQPAVVDHVSFTARTDEPAVLTWRALMAPRPRHRVGHHWWRDHVYDSWFWANHAWELAAEAATMGYATELKEYAEQHPRPNLGDFMRELSQGRRDLYELNLERAS